MATAKKSVMYRATGRRKESIAAVILRPGTGKLIVNGKEFVKYFHSPTQNMIATLPLTILEANELWDVTVKATGGGISGQVGAIRLGIARALVKTDESHRAIMRENGLMTRDARVVERKKYGKAKARKSFQFSKR
jgi:small subunit ribosomal protein S9